MAKEEIFHIQSERGDSLQPIPLRVIWPHAHQAWRNHGQSLLQLDQCGGLTPREALYVLYGNQSDERLERMDFVECHRELRNVVRQRYYDQIAEEERKQIYHPCTHPERPVDVSNGVRKCGKCGGRVAIPKDSIV